MCSMDENDFDQRTKQATITTADRIKLFTRKVKGSFDKKTTLHIASL